MRLQICDPFQDADAHFVVDDASQHCGVRRDANYLAREDAARIRVDGELHALAGAYAANVRLVHDGDAL